MPNLKFTAGDFVVYPAHGVGKIVGSELQEISGSQFELLVINFDKERMTLRLPINKAKAAGLRPLSTVEDMIKALEALRDKKKPKRAMWSRRAQEYGSKINTGDPLLIAQVVRELYRARNDSDQSYSERQIYQAALERLGRELAAVEAIEETAAIIKMEKILEAA